MKEAINARVTMAQKTEQEWLDSDVVLLAGEVGVASDTQVIKVGNGVDKWVDLKSHQGEKGDRGPKGAPLTFEDLTPEQVNQIKAADVDLSAYALKSEIIENLMNKADKEHKHEMGDINGLADRFVEMDNDLLEKANLTHTHSISQVDGLQAMFDDKVATTDFSNLDGRVTALENNQIIDVQVVTSMPSDPRSDTLYLVKG